MPTIESTSEFSIEPATEPAVESAVEMLYAPPEEVISVQAADPRIRWVIFIHLLAVGVCVAFSLSDRGLLINPQISRVYNENGSILFAASLFAWIACPIALVVQLFRTPVPPATRTLSVIAEALICVAHLYVLLPSVM